MNVHRTLVTAAFTLAYTCAQAQRVDSDAKCNPVDSIGSSMKKSGFPVRTPAFCSVSRGPSRLGEKECRAPSMTPGVALRPRTQGGLLITALPLGADHEVIVLCR